MPGIPLIARTNSSLGYYCQTRAGMRQRSDARTRSNQVACSVTGSRPLEPFNAGMSLSLASALFAALLCLQAAAAPAAGANGSAASPGSVTSERRLSTRIVTTKYGALRGFIVTLPNRSLQPVEVFMGKCQPLFLSRVPFAGIKLRICTFFANLHLLFAEQAERMQTKQKSEQVNQKETQWREI